MLLPDFIASRISALLTSKLFRRFLNKERERYLLGMRGQSDVWLRIQQRSGSVYTNAVSYRHGFTTSKLRQNRCGLEVFTRNRFRQKLQVVMLCKSAALRAKFTILDQRVQISRQIVIAFKSIRFCRLQDR